MKWSEACMGTFFLLVATCQDFIGLLLSSEAGKGSSKKIQQSVRRIFSEREVTLSWNRKVMDWGQGLTKWLSWSHSCFGTPWHYVTFTSKWKGLVPSSCLREHSGQFYPILFSVNSFLFTIFIYWNNIILIVLSKLLVIIRRWANLCRVACSCTKGY